MTNFFRALLFASTFLGTLSIGLGVMGIVDQPAQLRPAVSISCPTPGYMVDPCAKLDTSHVDDMRDHVDTRALSGR